MNCLFPVPDSQPTATKPFQSPLYGSGTVFRSISYLLRLFLSSALAWRHTSNSVTRNYCCRACEVTLSFMDTLIARTYLLKGSRSVPYYWLPIGNFWDIWHNRTPCHFLYTQSDLQTYRNSSHYCGDMSFALLYSLDWRRCTWQRSWDIWTLCCFYFNTAQIRTRQQSVVKRHFTSQHVPTRLIFYASCFAMALT